MNYLNIMFTPMSLFVNCRGEDLLSAPKEALRLSLIEYLRIPNTDY